MPIGRSTSGSRLLKLPRWLAAVPLLAAVASAQPAVKVVLHPSASGPDIPADFCGLSFEMKQVLPDQNGKYFFRADNQPLIATFRALGINSLRVGGNTTDTPTVPVPRPADLDQLFAFARAAGVRVIFTLRLRQGDPTSAAAVAKYVMDHYAAEVVCFAIGNEPNIYDPTYPRYVADLKKYIAAITAPGIAPRAVFCGPSTTPDYAEWARSFAGDFGPADGIRLITQHEYPGGNARAVTDVAAARDRMLSPGWLAEYAAIHDSFVPTAVAHGLPYRIEETNSFFNGGAKNVSDTMAAALWALDYLHWWAAHGAAGINFHTGDHVAAADELTPCYYAAFWTSPAGYSVHPVGYALKTFALGGHGQSVPMSVDGNTDGLNLTAYGVRAPDGSLTVTLINKEHGPAARAARVILVPGHAYRRGEAIYLTAPHGNVAATTGLTLGGAGITDDAAWPGAWTELPRPDTQGAFTVEVPATSAAVIRLMVL